MLHCYHVMINSIDLLTEHRVVFDMLACETANRIPCALSIEAALVK